MPAAGGQGSARGEGPIAERGQGVQEEREGLGMQDKSEGRESEKRGGGVRYKKSRTLIEQEAKATMQTCSSAERVVP